MLAALVFAALSVSRADDRTVEAVAVGLGPLGLEAAGVVGGAALVGGLAGGIGGSALMPRLVGLRSDRPVLYGAGALGVGLALGGLAAMTDSDALGTAAYVTVAVGIPVGAIIGAGGARERSRGSKRASVSAVPIVGKQTGLGLVGTF